MKRNRMALLVLLMLTSVLSIFCIAGCNIHGDPLAAVGPDFEGAWVATTPLPLTVTLTANQWSSVSGSLPDTESVLGTVTNYDTNLKHLLVSVTAESYTGSTPVTPTLPGTKIYCLYSIVGTTMTMAVSNSGYPTDLSSAFVFTKQ
jgi:hypothetical protein